MIRITINRNDIRAGHVIRLYEPPPGLAFNIAKGASECSEVVSAEVLTEDNVSTLFIKGELTSHMKTVDTETNPNF